MRHSCRVSFTHRDRNVATPDRNVATPMTYLDPSDEIRKHGPKLPHWQQGEAMRFGSVPQVRRWTRASALWNNNCSSLRAGRASRHRRSSAARRTCWWLPAEILSGRRTATLILDFSGTPCPSSSAASISRVAEKVKLREPASFSDICRSRSPALGSAAATGSSEAAEAGGTLNTCVSIGPPATFARDFDKFPIRQDRFYRPGPVGNAVLQQF